MALSVEKKAEIVGKFGRGDNDTGSPEAAISVLERLNNELPGNPEVLYALASWAQEQGDVAKAGRYQGQLQAVVQAAGLR